MYVVIQYGVVEFGYDVGEQCVDFVGIDYVYGFVVQVEVY